MSNPELREPERPEWPSLWAFIITCIVAGLMWAGAVWAIYHLAEWLGAP